MTGKRKQLTDREKEIVERIAHPLYTIDFLEEWIDRHDSVFANAPGALQACMAKGFYEAVKRIAAMETQECVESSEAEDKDFWTKSVRRDGGEVVQYDTRRI